MRLLIFLLLLSVNVFAQTQIGANQIKKGGTLLGNVNNALDCDTTNDIATKYDLTQVGGSGTVTSFSSGNLSPLFSTSVANASTTPALSFSLAAANANLVFATPNGSAGQGSYRALTSTDIPDLSSLYTITSLTLTINGLTQDLSANRTWTITATECEPDAITFTAQTGVNFNTVTTSNAVILNGGDSCVWSFVVRGGGSPQLQVNSESWATSGLARDGDTIKTRLTSANTSLTAVVCTLYTNTRSSTFSVTTDELEFLDVYGTNAAAAYSLRRLRVAYAGSAIRVRRSSDNAEQNIGFNAGHNLDTAALLTFVGANSAFIVTWYDQTTNARDAVQATTGNQPRIMNAGVIDRILGKPTILGGLNSNTNLKATFTLNQPANVFSVWNAVAVPGTVMAFDGTNASETALELKTGGGVHGEVYGGAYLTQTYPVTVGTPLLTSILFNGVSSNVYKNGASYATGNAGAVNPGGVTLFNYAGFGFGASVNISEYIVYSADKAADLSDINTNINTYYSIY